MIGVVKRLCEGGFGFISVKGSQDIFFHARDLEGLIFQDIKQGDRVEFMVTQTDKGPRAQHVRPVQE